MLWDRAEKDLLCSTDILQKLCSLEHSTAHITKRHLAWEEPRKDQTHLPHSFTNRVNYWLAKECSRKLVTGTNTDCYPPENVSFSLSTMVLLRQAGSIWKRVRL